MLYWLSGLSEGGDLFNLFRYITFRAGAAWPRVSEGPRE